MSERDWESKKKVDVAMTSTFFLGDVADEDAEFAIIRQKVFSYHKSMIIRTMVTALTTVIMG